MLHINKLANVIESLINQGKVFQAAQVLTRAYLRCNWTAQKIFTTNKRMSAIASNKKIHRLVMCDPLFAAWLAIQHEQRRIKQEKINRDFENRKKAQRMRTVKDAILS